MHKKIVWIVLSLASFNAAASSAIQHANNQAAISVGYLPTQIHHSPAIDNSNYLKGHQLELDTSITKTFYQKLYTQMALTATAGNLSYGKNTFLTTATTFLQQASLRLGYSLFPAERIGLTPYLTTGYQYWQLDSGGKPFHQVIRDGNTKFYQNGFLGLGLITQFALTPKLVADIDAQVGKTIASWMRYNAPLVPNPIIGTSTIYQQARLLSQLFYQIGAGIDYSVTPKIHANAGVKYNHMQYSSAVTAPSNLRQPHLSLANFNYNVGLGYSLDAPTDPIDTIHHQDWIADAIMKANNQASLWFGYVCQGYAETVPGMGHYFDREEGNIPVLNMALNKTFDRLYTQINMSMGGGNTAYKGGINGDPTAIFNTSTRNTLFSAGARLGFMFPLNDNSTLTPYLSGGFQRWLRDVAGVGDDGLLTFGYPETYQHAWYSIGLLAQYAPNQHWVVDIDGNVGSIQNGQNRSWSTLGEVGRTYQQIFSMKQRFIYNVGVGSDYRFMRNWHALAQVNYQYFKYGESDASVIHVDEPNSTTRLLSLLVGIGYAID